MAKPAFSLLTLCYIFLSSAISTSGGTTELHNYEKSWCVVKPSTDETSLSSNTEFACSEVDCSVIRKGGPCFNPGTKISHASVAMNLYYQSRGRNLWNCYFSGSGLVVLTDPSYGDCKYA